MHRKLLLAMAAAALLIPLAAFGGIGEAQGPPMLSVKPAPRQVLKQIIRQMRTNTAKAQRKALRRYRKMIVANRRSTWYWQGQALHRLSSTNHPERWSKSLKKLRYAALLWKKRAKAAWRYAIHPPRLKMWLCIHSGEASWKDHASHNPHYGGMQMGEWFMRHYAPELRKRLGTADHWSPLLQIWVAERAFEREHYSLTWLFGQWGDTAPPCV